MDAQRWRAWPNLLFPDLKAQWLLSKGTEIVKVVDIVNHILLLSKDGLVIRINLSDPADELPLISGVNDLCIISRDGLKEACNAEKESEMLLIMEDGTAQVFETKDFKSVCKVKTQEFSSAAGLLPMFKKAAAGDSHLVMLDHKGFLWSTGARVQSGHFQHIDADFSCTSKSDLLVTKIEFFQGHVVKDISAGADFTVAVVKRWATDPAEGSATTSSFSSSCPLGLPLDSSVEDRGAVELRKHKRRRRPPPAPIESHEEEIVMDKTERKTSEAEPDPVRVERLAKSGLYINPSDALQFLSNQLSWIGIGVNAVNGIEERKSSATARSSSVDETTYEAKEQQENVLLSCEHEQDDEDRSGLTRATSFVSDSMRAVGETVSRLSKSFSTDKPTDLFDDIATMNPEASSIIPLSPLENRPPSPLPIVRRPSQSKERKMSSLNRSVTLRPQAMEPCQTRWTPSRLAFSHRRSQSASFGLKLNEQDLIIPPPPPSDRDQDAFANDVWSWGKGRRGQQGLGDMLDRLQPAPIPSLSGQGVIKVACGKRHSLALTITGLVFGWGENSRGQACPNFNLAVCSIPQQINLPVGETATDIAAVENQSYILTDVGNVYCCGCNNDSNEEEQRSIKMTKLDLDDAAEMTEERGLRKILASRKTLCGSVEEEMFLPLCNLKALEKLFLHKVRQILSRVIEPLCEVTHDQSDQANEARSRLIECCNRMIALLCQSILASWDGTCLENCTALPLFKSPDTFSKAVEDYSRAACDCLVVDCVKLEHGSKVSSNVMELLQKLCHIHQTEDSEDMLQFLLLDPTNQLEHYISCLKAMLMAGQKSAEVSQVGICDKIEKAIAVFKNANKNVERERKSLRKTREFWEVAGTKFSMLKRPKRRVVLDSKESSLTVAHATSFSKHWIILMNDVLVHAGYSSYVVHPLQTVWIESHQLTSPISSSGEANANGGNKDLEITLVLPEETLVLMAANPVAKSDWFACLQRCIIETLGTNSSPDFSTANNGMQKSFTPPIIRHTSYAFSKMPDLKGAEYEGAWIHGKLHGQGKLTWSDGRCYQGQFRQNQKHGSGKMEVVDASGNKTAYDGQWKCDKFEGRGKICYSNGDVYKGMVKDGKPHGQGTFKQGKFMGSGASVYIGEWNNGFKCGYGVLDDIIAGVKYMGMWSNDMKNGPGCVVTLDGVYYEGSFSHNKMSGRGLMIFEDETVYEGYFADAGVFSGAGTLSYVNGDKLEGSFYGNYTDGMKFNGTIYKMVRTPQGPNSLTPHGQSMYGCDNAASTTFVAAKDKIGMHSVPVEQKWKSIYSIYHDILSLPERGCSRQNIPNTLLIWEQLAININQNKNNARLIMQLHNKEQTSKMKHSMTLSAIAADVLNTSGMGSNLEMHDSTIDMLEGLETIPDYAAVELTPSYLNNVNEYLKKAFSSPFHPLASLLLNLCDCFTATYGGVRVHPRLLKHAVEEMKSIVEGVYYFVRALFPALPRPGYQHMLIDEYDSGEEKFEYVTATSIIYPHLLPKIHSSIFMLYALYYKKDDDEYWARILKWNRHPDLALLSFLGVDQKFWELENNTDLGSESIQEVRRSMSIARDVHFSKAVETLQQLKTTFTPCEKLNVLLETFKEINKIGQEACGSGHYWSMDDLFPVFQYIVVRARILQLGAEIHMIEDLMESYLFSGENGIMFTTLQASYYQILKESISMY